MPDLPHQSPAAMNEPTDDLVVLSMLLDRAESAIQLVDATTMPRSHAALLNLLSRVGYEIEKAMQIGTR